MFESIPNTILSLVYPQQCTLCSRLVDSMDDGDVCSWCWEQTRFFTGLETLCARCGAFLSDAEPLFETYCHRCDDAFFDHARSLGPYRGAIAASVISLKHKPTIAGRLKKALVSVYFDNYSDTVSLIIPVPLSAKRRKERGFNQAAVIARIIADKARISFDENSLMRTVHTPMHRAGMDRKARESTVKGVFSVKRRKLIDGQRILLVDDVFTSGATVSACSKVLKKNGAATVNVLTIGRAVITQ